MNDQIPNDARNAPAADPDGDEGLTYRAAGVDIDAGHRLVERIKPAVARTMRPEVMAGLGGFGAMFSLPPNRFREPVLVSGTDGVGTKLRLAINLDRHQGIGIDLVAMCVNDILVQGAEPLFFLDYFATGRLDVERAVTVVESIARGCELAGAALIGGETAEMPGMYDDGDYDLAGFCVGIVERERIIDGSAVAPGDVLIGLESTGPHSNGYSLIRRIIEHAGADLDADLDGRPLGEALLAPTRIYVKPLLALLDKLPVHAMAHITGGGLTENVPRMLPAGTRAVIDADSWPQPAVFRWLQEQGQVQSHEMYRTFNCGIGMVACLPADRVEAAIAHLAAEGVGARPIGVIEAGEGPATVELRGANAR